MKKKKRLDEGGIGERGRESGGGIGEIGRESGNTKPGGGALIPVQC